MKYADSRSDQMIRDALGQLQGSIDKGTITKANAGDKHSYYSNFEKQLPVVEDPNWYAKIDVRGMPGFANQKDRGTPRVILLVDGLLTQAWYSAHYTSFDLLDEKFFKMAESFRKLYSK